MTAASLARAVMALLVVAGALAAAPDLRAEPHPLADLAGAWRGSGTLTPLGGDAERVICRVSYTISEAKVVQDINCAGTDYKFHAVGTLTHKGGKLIGSWVETNYGTRGGAYGSVTGNTVYVRISSDTFNARMKITFSSVHHTVQIAEFDPGKGTYRDVANIDMRR